jgi:hypothetical protein
VDDLTVRYLTDDELLKARSGGPLEAFGAQRTDLPARPRRTVGADFRTPWRRPQADTATRSHPKAS